MFRNLIKVLSILLTLALPVNALAADKVVLKEGNFVTLRGEVSTESVSKVISEVLSSKSNEVILFISSPGGSILDGLQMIQALRDSGKKLKCVATTAASMAFIILQACDERLVSDSALLMQHVASYGIQGDAPNNMSLVKFLNRMIKRIDEWQAKRLGLTYQEFKRKTRSDWWMLGQEAVDNKAADSVVAVTCDRDLAAKRIKEDVDMLFFQLEVTWSACPLVEAPLEVKVKEKSEGVDADQLKKEYDKATKRLYYRRELEKQLFDNYSEG